jgi:ryanodine receptor 2
MRHFKPKPIDISGIRLTDDVLKLSESLAKNAHNIWASDRIANGWRFGPARDDGRKEHPCLVPYEELPESEKAYDRHIVLGTLKAILALGYQVQKLDCAALE